MKFDCGPTWEEERGAKERWHRWFAWYPVRIGRQCYWLETIERQGTFNSTWADDYWTYQYRLPIR